MKLLLNKDLYVLILNAMTFSLAEVRGEFESQNRSKQKHHRKFMSKTHGGNCFVFYYTSFKSYNILSGPNLKGESAGQMPGSQSGKNEGQKSECKDGRILLCAGWLHNL